MPRNAIDYSNTIIYKLCCNDPSITDVYVGHTTNFTRRKQEHKACCNNPKGKNYNFYVYEFIRDHGGFENWDMIVLETKSCTDGNDARKLEREWFENKGARATLNGCRPIISKDEILEYNKIYNHEHRDEINEKHKIYYHENREECNEKMKIYYQEHMDEILEKKKIYYQEHRKEIIEKKKIYNQEHRDEISEYQKIYRQEHREEINRKDRERYALKKLQKITSI